MAPQRGVTVGGPAAPGPHGLLTAPLSGLECVWYRVRAGSWQAYGNHWRPVLGVQRGNPFAVDGILIEAELALGAEGGTEGGAEAILQEEVRIRRPPTPAEAPMLHRLASLGLLPPDELKRSANAFDVLVWQVTEEVIRPGVALEARGTLVTRRGHRRLRRARWWHAAV